MHGCLVRWRYLIAYYKVYTVYCRESSKLPPEYESGQAQELDTETKFYPASTAFANWTYEKTGFIHIRHLDVGVIEELRC